jgi:GLPGLI family protein
MDVIFIIKEHQQMKKIVATFILIFIITNSFSQEKLNIVTYKITNDIVPTEKQKNSVHAESIKNIFEEIRKIEYVLKFNENESIFIKNEKMIVNESKNSFSVLASKILAGEGVFYRDKNTQEILNQERAFSKLFLITKDPEKWNLTNDSKKIGDFLCFKASLKETYLGRTGAMVERNITAWYTLDIPVPFGPLGYGNLPGLILELEKGKLVYYVTNIKFNQESNYKILKPKKGRKVTKKEYDSITKKLIDRRQE